MNTGAPKLTILLWRGARCRCPQCGQGRLFKHWLAMHEHCGPCGLRYLRDQGDLWGYIIVLDRLAFILPLIAMLYFRLYNPHSIWFVIFAVGLLVTLFATTPHRNGICLGVDYFIRRKWGDLSEDGDSGPPGPMRP